MESMSNIRKMAEQYFEDAVELRRRIHQQPELSMEEKETSALVREKLREYGISIAELPLETGVIGVLAGERPGRTMLLKLLYREVHILKVLVSSLRFVSNERKLHVV